MGSFAPGLAEQYLKGDSGTNAAKAYDADVLSGKYLNGSPQLDAMVSQTNDHARNGLAASLGTRGLTGGSAFGDIITRALAENETSLRYTDYGNERARMGEAANRAPQLQAAGYLPLSVLQSIAQTQQLPVQTAAGLGSTIGGLLGSYTNQVGKSTPSAMQSIGQALDIGKTIAGFF